ncbi:MAG: hypothetical protein HY779_03720, partial [Rubrobacteridae bacterium]|nr:hypothetical protein [Rubrobacteridae bacterium]
GLKENVIIGKLIPAATGMSRYRTIKIRTTGDEPDEYEVTEEEMPNSYVFGEEVEELMTEGPSAIDVDISEVLEEVVTVDSEEPVEVRAEVDNKEQD